MTPATAWEDEFETSGLETPAFVIDLEKLTANCRTIGVLERGAGAKVLIALKAFATWPVFDRVRGHVTGAAASGLIEARLARDEIQREVHVYSPAYADDEFDDICEQADHVVFNSLGQWRRFGHRARNAGRSCGLRINPEHSEVDVALYDPCAPGSRLGVRAATLDAAALDGLDGLHMHTLCERGVDALERTLVAVEARFAPALHQARWLNLGGGHLITRPGYDRDRLAELIVGLRKRYDLDVYLEPGAAFALDAGVLVASVLDIVPADVPVAILDTSATAHMPDVLEMPYRPRVVGAGEPGQYAHTYRLGGISCLAGDVVGDYSFERPLEIGTKLIFRDMAQYTMVKTTMFNGVRLPDIVIRDTSGALSVARRFGYEDYRARLG